MKSYAPCVERDSGGYRSDLGRRGTAKFFAMGLDSRDHTKSSPSGSGFFYTTSFVIATKTKIWHVRAQSTARRATGLQGGLVSRNHFHRLHRRHPRESGEPVHTNACVYWIPAFAGMTAVTVAPRQIISSTPSGRRFRQNPWRRYPNRPWPRNRISAADHIR
jgi:hypothetical protein